MNERKQDSVVANGGPVGAEAQLEYLANFIMAEVDGEPSQNEGAGECAVRIIRELQAEISNLRDEAREHLG